MEHSQDPRKKFSLLVAGDLAFPGLEGTQLSSLHGVERLVWADAFVCLSSTEQALAALFDQAQGLGIPMEQILAYVDHYPAVFVPPPGLTLLVAHGEESGEEFKLRFSSKIEALRQGRLHSELRRWEKSGVLSFLSEPERRICFEHARIAHALAYLYDFSPGRHALCIRLTLCARHAPLRSSLLGELKLSDEYFPPENAPWKPQLPFELILALCANLTLSSCGNPAQFRDAFRARSALLPFKLRNELKTQVEKILEPLWGGKNAA